MNKRITYKNLLQIVEKETGLDQKNSDKLVRRWFNIINEGLEQDGRVRISQFGTFILKAVKERKGINPQTRESLIIPAHTKVVFNSAKHLKEHVNKKYNLLEAKPIAMKEEDKLPKKDDNKSEPVKGKSDSELDDLINQIQEKKPAESKELKYKDTEIIKKEEKPKKNDTEQIRAEVEDKFAKNDFTPTGVMAAKEEKVEKKEEKSETKPKQEDKPLEPEKVEVIIKDEEKKSETKPEPPMPKKEEDKKSKLGLYIAIAAVIIILLLIVLFWKPWADEPQEIVEKPKPAPEVVKKEPPKPVVKKKEYKTPGGEHAVARGDKLWSLSDVFYRDAYLWPNIYRVNDESIPNPDILDIGEVVTVPPLEGTYRSLTAADSVNIAVGFYKAYEAYKRLGNQWAKYYLWACKKYDMKTFKDYQNSIERQDYQFALSMK